MAHKIVTNYCCKKTAYIYTQKLYIYCSKQICVHAFVCIFRYRLCFSVGIFWRKWKLYIIGKLIYIYISCDVILWIRKPMLPFFQSKMAAKKPRWPPWNSVFWHFRLMTFRKWYDSKNKKTSLECPEPFKKNWSKSNNFWVSYGPLKNVYKWSKISFSWITPKVLKFEY